MKVAVVTGSAKDLGRAIALALAKGGYTVVIHYLSSKKEAEEAFLEVKKSSPESILVQGDLKREDRVKKVFDDILNSLGRVDLLVNNVGNFLYRELSKTSDREFRDVVESNLYSTLFCSRAVLPGMRKQKSGQIINIGAVGCERITIRQKVVPYYLAKTGVYILTKAMAYEEAKYGIRINMISPASMVTDIFESKDFPMGRSASFDDVVRALMFLIFDEGSYINGANIEVAGGFVPGIE